MMEAPDTDPERYEKGSKRHHVVEFAASLNKIRHLASTLITRRIRRPGHALPHSERNATSERSAKPEIQYSKYGPALPQKEPHPQFLAREMAEEYRHQEESKQDAYGSTEPS